MSVAELLRSSSKGKLTYCKQIDVVKLKHELNEVSPPPLSRYHQEKEFSKGSVSFGLGSESSFLEESSYELDKSRKFDQEDGHALPKSPPPVLNVAGTKGSKSSGQESPQTPVTSPVQTDSPIIDPRVAEPISPDWWSSMEAVLRAEEVYRSKAKLSMVERSKLFRLHERQLAERMNAERQAMNVQREQLREKRRSDMDKRKQQGLQEASKYLENLKQIHEKHKEKIDTRQKEIEQKRLDLELEEKKKQAELESRLHALGTLQDEVEQNRAEFSQLHDSFPHKDSFPEEVAKFKAILDKVCAGLPAKILKAKQAGSVSNEVIAGLQSDSEKSKFTVQLLKKQIEVVEAKVKADAEKRKAAEAKEAENQKAAENAKKLHAELAQDFGVQALSYALSERQSKADLLAQVEASIKGFVSNPQSKQYRFDLQRAVNTPINAISGVDRRHLQDKLLRLLDLLRGQEVTISGRRVKVENNPEALLFCQNLVAKMLVRKGEEQVSSLHESAFPVAAVTLGVWSEFPQVGQLFLSHLQSSCPYVLPLYPTRSEGQSSADYHRSLGYKVEEDGTVEEQDKFLRRMSGLMRLYCACVVTAPPPSSNSQTSRRHPQDLDHAWAWLARTLDQMPSPDVTATLLYDVLASTGSALLRRYGPQFVKLVRTLHRHFLPKLKDVAVTSAALGRLQSFLEEALKSGGFPEPAGALPPGDFDGCVLWGFFSCSVNVLV